MAKQTLLAAKKISELIIIPQQRNSRQSKHKSRQNQPGTNTRHNYETHSKINSTLGK